MKKYFHSLWQPVSNGQLVIFRIIFGLLMAFHFARSISSGYVYKVYISIQHRFTSMGFDWLNVLHGQMMYGYYAIMIVAALMVSFGFLYRYSAVVLAIMWTAIYLSSKTHYNNHHYLMVLLCWLMVFVPANSRLSLDVRWRLTDRNPYCYRWQLHIFIFQIACVYFFAALAKINFDWLHAIPAKYWTVRKQGTPVIGWALRYSFAPWIISYGGLLFDLLVVPGLLYKKTRKVFFILSLVFHLTNAYLFSIGIFPFLAISLNIFFLDSSTFKSILKQPQPKLLPIPKYQKLVCSLLTLYVFIQLLLPLRHFFFSPNVDWTEEGYRLSWRMMLREKSGELAFKVKHPSTGAVEYLQPASFLDSFQLRDVAIFPDITWQAVQYLKQQYPNNGEDVQIYAVGKAVYNHHQAYHLAAGLSLGGSFSVDFLPFKTFFIFSTDVPVHSITVNNFSGLDPSIYDHQSNSPMLLLLMLVKSFGFVISYSILIGSLHLMN